MTVLKLIGLCSFYVGGKRVSMGEEKKAKVKESAGFLDGCLTATMGE